MEKVKIVRSSNFYNNAPPSYKWIGYLWLQQVYHH